MAAETFNPRALFLFGTYTIGKERLFLEASVSVECMRASFKYLRSVKHTALQREYSLKCEQRAIRSTNIQVLIVHCTMFQVARTMGKKVYVSKEKMAILQCCDLPPAHAELLTTNHLETNVHAVPLFKINVAAMTEILDQ